MTRDLVRQSVRNYWLDMTRDGMVSWRFVFRDDNGITVGYRWLETHDKTQATKELMAIHPNVKMADWLVTEEGEPQ